MIYNIVIEYQLQQYRLLPYLSGCVSMLFFSKWLYSHYFECVDLQKRGDNSRQFLSLNEEVHAISSGSKVCFLLTTPKCPLPEGIKIDNNIKYK